MARTALCAFGIALWLSASHAQSSDMELAAERDRLLTTYSVFTGYGAPSAVVYQRLEPDRKAVFDASIRAIIQAIEDRPGHSGGKREIDYLEEVRGIWGVRRNDTHGERMFRLSVLSPNKLRTRSSL